MCPALEKRMLRFAGSGLYLVTSQSVSAGRDTRDIVRAGLAAGIRLIQLREKELSTRALTELAREIRALTADAGALLIINDRIDVALSVGADGVHLGSDDLPPADARGIAPDLIIGVSCHNRAETIDAERQGASYVNIGPLFPTGTKEHAGKYLGIAGMRDAARGLGIPFTVMGGIKKEHIASLCRAGARTVAVVTAITAAPDPRAAAEDLLREIGARASPQAAAWAGEN